MKPKITNNDVGFSYIKLDEKNKAILLLLAKCAEETFDKARVVEQKEAAYLSASQYIKTLVNNVEK